MRQGTAESYHVFVRSWYGPDGEPQPGRKTTLARRCTYAEALALCEEYRREHNPGRRSRKAEFERE